MTKSISFQTDIGKFSIQLLSNPFVDQWLNHFIKMSTRYQITCKNRSWPYIAKNYLLVNEKIEKLLSAINLVNNIEYLTPLPETIHKDQLVSLNLDTQKTLNRLHRYAVTASDTRNRWIITSPQAFDWVPWEITEFNYAINLLNQSIHNLEDHVRTPHKEQFNTIWDSTEINFDASTYQDVTVYFDDVDVEITADMFQYLKLSGYDAWIKKDLLGKDFITGFADHDDPTQQDIRPPTMYSGGIQIDRNLGKNSIYNSKEFMSWLGQTPSDYHGNFPLGTVVNKHNLLNAKHITFIGIE